MEHGEGVSVSLGHGAGARRSLVNIGTLSYTAPEVERIAVCFSTLHVNYFFAESEFFFLFGFHFKSLLRFCLTPFASLGPWTLHGMCVEREEGFHRFTSAKELTSLQTYGQCHRCRSGSENIAIVPPSLDVPFSSV